MFHLIGRVNSSKKHKQCIGCLSQCNAIQINEHFLLTALVFLVENGKSLSLPVRLSFSKHSRWKVNLPLGHAIFSDLLPSCHVLSPEPVAGLQASILTSRPHNLLLFTTQEEALCLLPVCHPYKQPSET